MSDKVIITGLVAVVLVTAFASAAWINVAESRENIAHVAAGTVRHAVNAWKEVHTCQK